MDAETALRAATNDQKSRLAYSYITDQHGYRAAADPVGVASADVQSAQGEISKLQAIETSLDDEINRTTADLRRLRPICMPRWPMSFVTRRNTEPWSPNTGQPGRNCAAFELPCSVSAPPSTGRCHTVTSMRPSVPSRFWRSWLATMSITAGWSIRGRTRSPRWSVMPMPLYQRQRQRASRSNPLLVDREKSPQKLRCGARISRLSAAIQMNPESQWWTPRLRDGHGAGVSVNQLRLALAPPLKGGVEQSSQVAVDHHG